MDLNLSNEEVRFRDELRAWLLSNVPRDWNEWREKPIEESFPYLRAWQRKLHEGRWAAVSWPKEYGGRSATLMQQAIFLGRKWRDASRTVGNRGIQVHGGMGFTWESDVHLYYRLAKASETAFGDATFHRERIARLVIDEREASGRPA